MIENIFKNESPCSQPSEGSPSSSPNSGGKPPEKNWWERNKKKIIVGGISVLTIVVVYYNWDAISGAVGAALTYVGVLNNNPNKTNGVNHTPNNTKTNDSNSNISFGEAKQETKNKEITKKPTLSIEEQETLAYLKKLSKDIKILKDTCRDIESSQKNVGHIYKALSIGEDADVPLNFLKTQITIELEKMINSYNNITLVELPRLSHLKDIQETALNACVLNDQNQTRVNDIKTDIEKTTELYNMITGLTERLTEIDRRYTNYFQNLNNVQDRRTDLHTIAKACEDLAMCLSLEKSAIEKTEAHLIEMEQKSF